MEGNSASEQSSSRAEQTKPSNIKMPDGRRNSSGQAIPSPVAEWKPNFSRSMSWKMEDLKREHVASELDTQKDKYEAMGGFTETTHT